MASDDATQGSAAKETHQPLDTSLLASQAKGSTQRAIVWEKRYRDAQTAAETGMRQQVETLQQELRETSRTHRAELAKLQDAHAGKMDALRQHYRDERKSFIADAKQQTDQLRVEFDSTRTTLEADRRADIERLNEKQIRLLLDTLESNRSLASEVESLKLRLAQRLSGSLVSVIGSGLTGVGGSMFANAVGANDLSVKDIASSRSLLGAGIVILPLGVFFHFKRN